MSVTEVNNSEEGNKFERSWADLPELVLSKIFSLISLNLRGIMFSRVCKSWYSILQSPTQFKLNTKECSPHLLFTSNKLIHPILEKVYELKKFPETIFGVQLRTAIEDWLLFTQNSRVGINSMLCKQTKAFFFNPFTRAVVWLPNLLPGYMHSMCFSSTYFKVVAVRDATYEDEDGEWKTIVAIDTFKCGEDRWTSCEFEYRENSFELSYCNPVLYKGMYYILGKHSTLLIHDPVKKTFFIHKAPKFLTCDSREQYLLESDGKLLAVFVETSGSWVVVCRWNVSKGKWTKIETLKNEVLFVSRPYSMSETASANDTGNKIYFPRVVGKQCLFYSLDTKRFHIYDGSSFTSFHGSKSAFSSTWIKPSRMSADD